MPLDGGRVVQAALWRATGDRWCGWHVAAMLGIALGCVLVLAACVALLRGEATTGALLGFNAAMVLSPAWSACGPFAVYRRLQRTLVTDHLGAPETMLRDTQSIEEANADVFVQRPASCHHPVLDGDGRLLGLVHRPAVNAALGRGHGHLPLLHLMIPPGLDPSWLAEQDENLRAIRARPGEEPR